MINIALTEIVQLAMTGKVDSERLDRVARTIDSLQAAVKKANSPQFGDYLSHDDLKALAGDQLVGLCGEHGILFLHESHVAKIEPVDARPHIRQTNSPDGYIVFRKDAQGLHQFLNRTVADEGGWTSVATVWADAATAGRALDSFLAGTFDKFKAGRNKVVSEG